MFENRARLARAIELAFLGYAFKGFFGALDAILVVLAVGGKQFHDAIGTVRRHMADWPRGEVNGVTDLELMLFQR